MQKSTRATSSSRVSSAASRENRVSMTAIPMVTPERLTNGISPALQPPSSAASIAPALAATLDDLDLIEAASWCTGSMHRDTVPPSPLTSSRSIQSQSNHGETDLLTQRADDKSKHPRGRSNILIEGDIYGEFKQRLFQQQPEHQQLQKLNKDENRRQLQQQRQDQQLLSELWDSSRQRKTGTKPNHRHKSKQKHLSSNTQDSAASGKQLEGVTGPDDGKNTRMRYRHRSGSRGNSRLAARFDLLTTDNETSDGLKKSSEVGRVLDELFNDRGVPDQRNISSHRAAAAARDSVNSHNDIYGQLDEGRLGQLDEGRLKLVKEGTVGAIRDNGELIINESTEKINHTGLTNNVLAGLDLPHERLTTESSELKSHHTEVDVRRPQAWSKSKQAWSRSEKEGPDSREAWSHSKGGRSQEREARFKGMEVEPDTVDSFYRKMWLESHRLNSESEEARAKDVSGDTDRIPDFIRLNEIITESSRIDSRTLQDVDALIGSPDQPETSKATEGYHIGRSSRFYGTRDENHAGSQAVSRRSHAVVRDLNSVPQAIIRSSNRGLAEQQQLTASSNGNGLQDTRRGHHNSIPHRTLSFSSTTTSTTSESLERLGAAATGQHRAGDSDSGSSTVLVSPAYYHPELAQRCLEQLRLEEEQLLELKRQQELERIRGPQPKWYMMKGSQFHEELRKDKALRKNKAAWQTLLDYRTELERASRRYQQTLTNHKPSAP